MSGATLHLLDEPHLRSEAGLAALPSNVPGFLLAYLALHGDWQSREAVTAAFWPDRSASEGLHNLRVNLHRARQWLASLGLGERLEGERRRVRLALDCDVHAFRRAIDGPDAAAALDSYRRPFMHGMTLPGFPAIDDWLARERDAIARAWQDASLAAAARLESAGRDDEAWRLIQAVCRHDGASEAAVQAALRLARNGGEAARGLELFDRFAARLRSEVGAAPLAETSELARRLRAVEIGRASCRERVLCVV